MIVEIDRIIRPPFPSFQLFRAKQFIKWRNIKKITFLWMCFFLLFIQPSLNASQPLTLVILAVTFFLTQSYLVFFAFSSNCQSHIVSGQKKIMTSQQWDCGSHCRSLTIEGSLLAPSINSSSESLPSIFLSICLNILSVRFSGVDSSSGIFITEPTILYMAVTISSISCLQKR